MQVIELTKCYNEYVSDYTINRVEWHGFGGLTTPLNECIAILIPNGEVKLGWYETLDYDPIKNDHETLYQEIISPAYNVHVIPRKNFKYYNHKYGKNGVIDYDILPAHLLKKVCIMSDEVLTEIDIITNISS